MPNPRDDWTKPKQQPTDCHMAFGEHCPVNPTLRPKLWKCQACYELQGGRLPDRVKPVVDPAVIADLGSSYEPPRGED